MIAAQRLRALWRGRLTVRLIAGVFLLAALGAVAIGYARFCDEERQAAALVRKIGTSLGSTASVTLPDAILAEDVALLEAYCKDLVENHGVPIVFVSVDRADGKRLASRGALPPDPAAAGVELVVAPAMLRPEGKILGRTTIGLDTTQIRGEVAARARSLFLQNLAVAVLIALALVGLLHALVLRRLSSLDAQAARIGEGDLDSAVTADSEDEFGRLAATMERMRANLKASHASLREQNERLLELDRLKDEFLANVSHEIRTPLQAILGNASLLQGASPAQLCDYIGSIERNTNHLLGLVNQMLDFSKLRTGNLSIEHHVVDLAPLVADVVDCMRPEASRKGLALESEFGEGVPSRILTDPLRLRQILMNLVGNAVKFTHRGRVRIAVESLEGPRIQFSVSDTGIGIRLDRQRQLFRPFVTADPSLTRRQGGAGLGLVISRELARLLGGDITIASREGYGTTAVAVIDAGEVPAEAADRGAPGWAAPKGAAPRVPGRVLLVDDAEDNRRFFAVVLRKAGLDVSIAGNGEEAVESLEASLAGGAAFDLVLMDIQMPVMDGRAAASRMRDLGYRAPIVALTAHATGADRRLCLAAGFDDYLTKPIAPAQLTDAIRRHIEGARAAGRL
ncbi:MAG: hypothetical protein Fur0037_24350 [Planctomycetota bacterium]